MCYDPHESQKTIEAEERKFNREYEEEQERLREEANERDRKEMEDDMPRLSDEVMIKEAQYKIIETIVNLEDECALKPSTVMVYKDAVTCGWVCKIGMEVRT
jgi:hypothetical protein